MGAEESSSLNDGISVPWEPAANENESPVYINNIRIQENGGLPMRYYSWRGEARTSIDCLDSAAVIYGKKNAFGEREVLPDGSYGEYKWITYLQFQEQARSFASGLKQLGVKYGDRVGIYSINCIGWQLTQFACHYLGAMLFQFMNH